MRTIYKYEVSLTSEITPIPLPALHKIVKVGESNGKVCIWVELTDTNHVMVNETKFRIYGTGWEIDPKDEYVGTAIMKDGYVWHVYKIGE